MNEDENIVFRVKIPDPIEYISITGKRIQKDTGLPKTEKYYLTANLFYGGIHFKTKEIILNAVKEFLLPFLSTCPELTNPPYSLVIQYCSPKTNFDLDNKCYFWQKIINDMLSPPAKMTSRTNKDGEVKQIAPSKINLQRKLQGDSVKYIDCIGWEYYKTEETYLVVLIIKN